MTDLTRQQAHDLLTKYVKGEHYITHSYAVEAIMRGLAKRLAPQDEELWAICGLLHDLDEETAPWREDMATHGPVAVQILRSEGINNPVLENAIMAHNPICGKNPETTLEFAIIAADPMSGFLKAVAQIYPDKKLASVKRKSVTKRFKETRFAAGANRDFMMLIEKTGISWDEFIDIAMASMLEIADEIGL
ncbi:MAG: HD domain-containing protein [Clostridiales bacterium]|nr:HD domain-containing protein [Clostridiales bacterium]